MSLYNIKYVRIQINLPFFEIIQFSVQNLSVIQSNYNIRKLNQLSMVHFRKSPLYYLWPLPWGQGYTKCCPVPSTSHDLCTCKIWSCYVQLFRRRCIYKNDIIWPLTLSLGLRSYEVLFSTLKASTSFDLYTWNVWRCHVEGLRRICFYKKILYLTFEPDRRVKVTENFVQYPLHHVTYAPVKFEVNTSNG